MASSNKPKQKESIECHHAVNVSLSQDVAVTNFKVNIKYAQPIKPIQIDHSE
jgi:hypothetical protein